MTTTRRNFLKGLLGVAAMAAVPPAAGDLAPTASPAAVVEPVVLRGWVELANFLMCSDIQFEVDLDFIDRCTRMSGGQPIDRAEAWKQHDMFLERVSRNEQPGYLYIPNP